MLSELNIIQAVKHLSWRLQNSKINPNDKDREAFNLIVKTLNQNYEDALMEDKLFAKLLIEKLIMLTAGTSRTMKSALESVEELLECPLEVWGEKFKKEVPRIRLMRAFEKQYVLVPKSDNEFKNAANVREAKNKIMVDNQKQLIEEFKSEYTDAEFKSFIKKLVYDLKKEYQNKP